MNRFLKQTPPPIWRISGDTPPPPRGGPYGDFFKGSPPHMEIFHPGWGDHMEIFLDTGASYELSDAENPLIWRFFSGPPAAGPYGLLGPPHLPYGDSHRAFGTLHMNFLVLKTPSYGDFFPGPPAAGPYELLDPPHPPYEDSSGTPPHPPGGSHMEIF